MVHTGTCAHTCGYTRTHTRTNTQTPTLTHGSGSSIGVFSRIEVAFPLSLGVLRVRVMPGSVGKPSKLMGALRQHRSASSRHVLCSEGHSHRICALGAGRLRAEHASHGEGPSLAPDSVSLCLAWWLEPRPLCRSLWRVGLGDLPSGRTYW